jgi:hypothetical protein
MTKLVLGIIRKKKVASRTPFINMRNDYPPQKEKVQSQTKYKPSTLLKEKALKVKNKKHIKRQTSHVTTDSSMETPSMVIAFLVKTFIRKHWNARVLKIKIQEGPIT